MKRYTDTVLSIATGLPLIGATVTVYLSGTTTKATLYASNDEAGATLPNPVINRGGFSFYAKDGKYDLAIKAGLINRLLPDVDIYDLEELSRLVRERPAKGDPGGNVMDVGPFSALADISVPLGTTQVRTSGNTRAWLIEDTTLTDAAVAAHPLCITKTRNGRYFRLDDLQTIPITAAGAVGGALNPDLTFNLAAIDCRPALLALLAPWITQFDPVRPFPNSVLTGPGAQFLLGTDGNGAATSTLKSVIDGAGSPNSSSTVGRT